jgi:hypothetical protein
MNQKTDTNEKFYEFFLKYVDTINKVKVEKEKILEKYSDIFKEYEKQKDEYNREIHCENSKVKYELAKVQSVCIHPNEYVYDDSGWMDERVNLKCRLCEKYFVRKAGKLDMSIIGDKDLSNTPCNN